MQFGTGSSFPLQPVQLQTHRTKTCFGKGAYQNKQKGASFQAIVPNEITGWGKVKIFSTDEVKNNGHKINRLERRL